MSYAPPPSNPFAVDPYPVGPQVPLKAPPAVRFEYMRAYSYIFENPNWMTNVLWGFLCFLSTGVIPIVGQLVFFGYQFEIIEALLMARGARYLDFDTNRFGDYIGRGIWPFLVQLLFGMIVIVPGILFTYVGAIAVGALGAAIGGQDAGVPLAIIFVVLFFCTAMLCLTLLSMLTIPMTIRAGLSQDFGQAFNIGWAVNFIKKTWVEMLLSGLFIMASSMLFMPLGLLACGVGVFAAQVIVMLGYTYFQYQLYALFLARGGEPIPLKPRLAQPMMSPPMMPPTARPPGF